MARRDWKRRLRKLGQSIDGTMIAPRRVKAAQEALDRGETGEGPDWTMARNIRLALIEIEPSVYPNHQTAASLVDGASLSHPSVDEMNYAHNILALFDDGQEDPPKFVEGPQLVYRYDLM